MTKTALVLGATGLAGRHLTTLLSGSDELKLVGTFYTSNDYQQNKFPGCLTQCDVTDKQQLNELVECTHPDIVYHFGAYVSVADSHKNPKRFVDTNVLGTINLLTALSNIDNNVSVVVPGSAEEYGPVTSDELPISEKLPTRPTNPYGISKVAQEHFSRYFGERFNLDVFLPRTFHYTGPYQPATFVCSDFASQVASIERGDQQEIRVGNLDAKRDFLDIRDVVRAYELMIKSAEPGVVYNVCSGESIKIAEILEILTEMSPADIPIIVDQNKMRPLDVPDFQGDNTKLRQATGWKRRLTIEQTLEDLLNFHREGV